LEGDVSLKTVPKQVEQSTPCVNKKNTMLLSRKKTGKFFARISRIGGAAPGDQIQIPYKNHGPEEPVPALRTSRM
jgi:hypothetical protein